MYNFHPVLTSFPFALLSCVLVAELLVLFWPKPFAGIATLWVLVCSILGTLAAFFSGYQASDLANASFVVSDSLIENHHSWGRLLLFAIFPCLALKYAAVNAKYSRNFFKASYLVLLVTCWLLALYTGYLGGNLVFKHGAGVRVQQFLE